MQVKLTTAEWTLIRTALLTAAFSSWTEDSEREGFIDVYQKLTAGTDSEGHILSNSRLEPDLAGHPVLQFESPPPCGADQG